MRTANATTLGVVLTALLGCAGLTTPEPTGPVPLLACDYEADVLTHTSHSCQEVRAPEALEGTRAFWDSIGGPRDTVTCAENARCPVSGRVAGCVTANGNVEWEYVDDVETVKRGCSSGVVVMPGEELPPLDLTTYRCAQPGLCVETRSTIPLEGTAKARNCSSGGQAEFRGGECPAEDRVGLCQKKGRDYDETWVFYPERAERMEETCERLEGAFKRL
jgi:hypothetical protein